MKIWFQNRRTKWKKQDNISNAEAAEHKNQNSPKVTSQPSSKIKHRSGNTDTDSLRSGFEGSSDSNNSLLVSDSCAIDSDSSADRRTVPSTRTLHASSSSLVALSLPERRNNVSTLPTDSMLPSERHSANSPTQYNSQNHDDLAECADSRFKEYEFKREQKISSRDLVAAKGESRIGANYQSSAKKNTDEQEKTLKVDNDDNSQLDSESRDASSEEKKFDKCSVPQIDEISRKDDISPKTPS